MMREFTRPTIDVEGTDYGLRLFTLRKINEKHTHVRVTNLVFPYAFVIPMSTEMTITQWHVPIDDTSCYWYAIFTSFGKPVDHQQMREQRLQLYELPDYRPRIGRHNNYGYNVAEQKTPDLHRHGLRHQRARPVGDREPGPHPGPHARASRHSDKAIVAYRRLLLSAIGQVANGEKPPMWLDPARAAAIRGPVDRRRHGPDRGLGVLLEGVRRAPPQRLELGGQDALAAGGVRRAMTLVERPVCGPTNARPATREAERRIQAGELSVVRLAFADQHGVLRGKTLDGGRDRRRAEERRRLHHHHAAEGHRAPHGVPGLAAGRRLRHEGAGGRGRRDDAARSRDLPRPALGAAFRLDAVRHLLRRRPADAARHAPCLPPRADDAGRPRLRLHRRPRSRVPSLQAGEDEPRHRRCRPARPARRAARRVAAEPGLPVPDRAALRRDGSRSSRSCAPTSSISACRCARIEVEFGPSQVEFTFRAGTGLEPADAMVLFRSAAKQVAQRHGYHAHLHVPAAAAPTSCRAAGTCTSR